MKRNAILGVAAIFLAIGLAAGVAEEGGSWETSGGNIAYRFDTGMLSGVFVGHDPEPAVPGAGRHGLRELRFGADGKDLHPPEGAIGGKRRVNGMMHLYRVYAGAATYGALRDFEAEVERRENGALLTWEASPSIPVRISAEWIITGPAQIDLSLKAVPETDLAMFEILPANYVALEMVKGVYLRGEDGGKEVTEYRRPQSATDAGTYPFFPLAGASRANQARSWRFGTAWAWPSRVAERDAAVPLIFAHDGETEIVFMGDPDSVSAVCITPTPEGGDPATWSKIEQHSSAYFSLFCRDVKAGEILTSRMRMVVREPTGDDQAAHEALYRAFLEEE